jgi:hypothetical protein
MSLDFSQEELDALIGGLNSSSPCPGWQYAVVVDGAIYCWNHTEQRFCALKLVEVVDAAVPSEARKQIAIKEFGLIDPARDAVKA